MLVGYWRCRSEEHAATQEAVDLLEGLATYAGMDVIKVTGLKMHLRVEDFLKEVQRTGHVVMGDRSERRKDFSRLQNEYSLVK